MTQTIAFELDVPDDLAKLRLPGGVDSRLHELLDRQDQGQKLTVAEREEAQGLVTLAEFLSLLKMRSRRKPVRPGQKSR
jgi:hypothetical protein